MPVDLCHTSNGLKMIKHQVDIVSVVSKNCPLHGDVANEKKRNNIHSCEQEDTSQPAALSLSSDDNVKTEEVNCICEIDDKKDLSPTIHSY